LKIVGPRDPAALLWFVREKNWLSEAAQARVAVGLSMLLLAACSSDPDRAPNEIGPEGGTAVSADGKLTLTFPPGSVSDVQQITIEPLDVATELPAEFAGLTIDVAYELGPDGMVFDVPITAEFLTDSPAIDENGELIANYSLLLTESDDGGVDALDNMVTELSYADNTVVEKAEMSHFSTFVIKTRPFGGIKFVSKLDVVTAWPVGEPPFTAKVKSETRSFLTGETRDWPGFDSNYNDSSKSPLRLVAPAEYLVDFTGFEWFADYDCTEVGTGQYDVTIDHITELNYAFGEELTFPYPVNRKVRFEVPIQCLAARETKAEFGAEETDLGSARTADLETGSSASVNLADHGGKFGYYVTIKPGQTVEGCAMSSGGTSITYYPEFSPGFDFTNTTPGCTNINNPDPTLSNRVLMVIEGSGIVDVSAIER
jgi:hypothetical protein